jgi:DNA-binding XRE family transcriptional regulator
VTAAFDALALIEDWLDDPGRGPDPIMAAGRRIRIEQGVSVSDMAAHLGKSRSTVESWESGRRSAPMFAVVRLYFARLGHHIPMPVPVPQPEDDPGCHIDPRSST